jgi:glycosyltransferase involved in cell wall biosynthesis
VTLLICTRDRAGMLAGGLEALRALEIPDGVGWEVVVVDNASGDDTGRVVEAFAASPGAPSVRLVREDRRGVGFARKRGLRESRGELVAFLDDDCVLEPDWLVATTRFAREHPRAGAFGGRNALDWEREPTALLSDYGDSFARQDWGDRAFGLPRGPHRWLCGAGLVLRREAVLDAGYAERGMLRGRHSGGRGAGEDGEVQLLVRQRGWETWYAPTLRLAHRIPAQRMGLRHLCVVNHGFGRREPYLRLLAGGMPLTIGNRLLALRWAVANLGTVLARFWKGFVRYRHERPALVIRLAHAVGGVEGAVVLLLVGRLR